MAPFLIPVGTPLNFDGAVCNYLQARCFTNNQRQIAEGVLKIGADMYVGLYISVEQSVHDGSKFRPVVGGFHSGKITKKGYFEQQFNLVGEYRFAACVSAFNSLLNFYKRVIPFVFLLLISTSFKLNLSTR